MKQKKITWAYPKHTFSRQFPCELLLPQPVQIVLADPFSLHLFSLVLYLATDHMDNNRLREILFSKHLFRYLCAFNHSPVPN